MTPFKTCNSPPSIPIPPHPMSPYPPHKHLQPPHPLADGAGRPTHCCLLTVVAVHGHHAEQFNAYCQAAKLTPTPPHQILPQPLSTCPCSFHTLWLTVPAAAATAVWWWLFLGVMPEQFKAYCQEAERRGIDWRREMMMSEHK